MNLSLQYTVRMHCMSHPFPTLKPSLAKSYPDERCESASFFGAMHTGAIEKCGTKTFAHFAYTAVFKFRDAHGRSKRALHEVASTAYLFLSLLRFFIKPKKTKKIFHRRAVIHHFSGQQPCPGHFEVNTTYAFRFISFSPNFD